MAEGGKILVIRGGAIGDFVLTLPVLSALRQHFPEAALELLGYPRIAQLAMLGRLADRVHSIESRALAGFFGRPTDLDPDLADYFSEFDLIISYLYDPDRIFEGNVRRCSAAQYIAGPHRPQEAVRLPAGEAFLKPLEQLAIFDADPVARLDFEIPLSARLPAGAWLALHPGSGAERKNWAEANWRELVENLVRESSDARFLLLGGEAEGDRLQRMSVGLPADRIRLVQNLTLPDLALLLKQCRGYVGHDSGITHLASAVGLAGVVMWGETDLKVWAPQSPSMTILKIEGGLERLSVERVLEAIKGLLQRSSVDAAPRG